MATAMEDNKLMASITQICDLRALVLESTLFAGLLEAPGRVSLHTLLTAPPPPSKPAAQHHRPVPRTPPSSFYKETCDYIGSTK